MTHMTLMTMSLVKQAVAKSAAWWFSCLTNFNNKREYYISTLRVLSDFSSKSSIKNYFVISDIDFKIILVNFLLLYPFSIIIRSWQMNIGVGNTNLGSEHWGWKFQLGVGTLGLEIPTWNLIVKSDDLIDNEF